MFRTSCIWTSRSNFVAQTETGNLARSSPKKSKNAGGAHFFRSFNYVDRSYFSVSLFWELLYLDARLSLSLGRPPSLSLAHMDCHRPSYAPIPGSPASESLQYCKHDKYPSFMTVIHSTCRSRMETFMLHQLSCTGPGRNLSAFP